MNMKAILAALPIAMILATVLAANTEYLQVELRAKEMGSCFN